MLAGAMLLGGMYVLPLWRVDLGAPQYPEGLGLLIRINSVEGQKPQDLRNINSLNRYIGMRPIEPDAIPELRYMPWILGGLIAFGVATAVIARRRMLWAWLATLVAAGALGLYDFWRWGHEYGHNLDEATAIIKVPGMTYSPPVIGTKQLLNFTATSLPDWGAYLAGVAFLLGVLSLWFAYRLRQTPRPQKSARGSGAVPGNATLVRSVAATLLFLVPFASACTTSAAPVRYGEVECAHCRMVITDARFGGSVVSAKGRTTQFDSIDCLLAYVRALPPADVPRAVLVADFLNPGSMLPAEDAMFVRSGSVHGPMGADWVAVTRGAESRIGEPSAARSYDHLLASDSAAREHGHPVEGR